MTGRRYLESGKRWRKGIAAKGLTTAEVARRLGVIHGREVTRQSIDQVVQGVSPGLVHVEHVAKMLDCSVEYLTSGTGAAPSWAAPRARDVGQAYDAPPPAEAPPWARLLAEVRALRAEVAELRGRHAVAPRGDAADEIAAIMDPDEHPRPQAPTYPRPPVPAPAPRAADHGR